MSKQILIVMIALNIITFVAVLTDHLLTNARKEVKLIRQTPFIPGLLSTVDLSQITTHYMRDKTGKYFIVEIPSKGRMIVLRWRYFDV